MNLTVIESPFAGKGDTEAERDIQTERNLRYVRAAMADCFAKGEEPYASHALYTQPGVLNDKLPEERKKGMEAGFRWGSLAAKRVLYMDLGMSSGMEAGLEEAKKHGQKIEIRKIPNWELIENNMHIPVSLAAQLSKAINALPRPYNTDGFEDGYSQAILDVLNLIASSK